MFAAGSKPVAASGFIETTRVKREA